MASILAASFFGGLLIGFTIAQFIRIPGFPSIYPQQTSSESLSPPVTGLVIFGGLGALISLIAQLFLPII